jgi:hypothetical protein
LVPRGTELDLWRGEALVSVLGFLFLRCRVLGAPIPWHRNFEEVNLRFYVRRLEGTEVRRGVVFVKEIVPRPAIALVARLIYNEPYVARPMHHRRTAREVDYAWRAGDRWESVGAELAGEMSPLPIESEAEFIFEHYWGYTRQRDGGTLEYQVEHPRWEAAPMKAARLRCDVASLYGSGFLEALSAAPQSAFLAEGSEVRVRRGVRIA